MPRGGRGHHNSDAVRIGVLAVVQDGESGTTLELFRELSEARLEASARF